MAVSRGGAAISTPPRGSVGWPSRIAPTTAGTPAARDARPRAGRPGRAPRTGPPGGRDRGHEALQDAGRGPATHRRLDTGKEPVGEHRGCETEDVVRQDEVATLHRGRRLRGPHQVQGGAR